MSRLGYGKPSESASYQLTFEIELKTGLTESIEEGMARVSLFTAGQSPLLHTTEDGNRLSGKRSGQSLEYGMSNTVENRGPLLKSRAQVTNRCSGRICPHLQPHQAPGVTSKRKIKNTEHLVLKPICRELPNSFTSPYFKIQITTKTKRNPDIRRSFVIHTKARD